ncbi:MAG: hypothetical protein K2I20_02065 [Clostridia bacterium]|nr:hypothetical protein [Clostridia bacterium]
MKVKKFLTPLILVCIALFAAVGCAGVEVITDIAGYENFQRGGDKIDVVFENGTQSGFEFTIEDKDEIDEIVNLALTTRLNNAGKRPFAPGQNTYITIYQGEKSYNLNVVGVTSGEYLYVFATTDLNDKIRDMAERLGAFSVSDK